MSVEKTIKYINENIDKELLKNNIVFKEMFDEIKIGLVKLSAIKDPIVFSQKFNELLQKVGYYKLINNFISVAFDTNYEAIKKLFEAGGLSLKYSAKDVEIFKALKKLEVEKFTLLAKEANNALTSSMYKFTYSTFNKEDIADTLLETIEDTRLLKYANTYAQTAISNYNQSVMDIKSEGASGEVYIYVGVDDKKTRDFCECILDQNFYYDKNNAEKLKRDKRRKYNCRHLIVPVSLEYATKEGYNKGVFKC